MQIELDQNVQIVAEFMQSNFPADDLTAIASGVSAVAPILWGKYGNKTKEVLRLRSAPISDHSLVDDRHIQLAAT
jgi:hypothetical protein